MEHASVATTTTPDDNLTSAAASAVAQGRLDALVTQIATMFMQVSAGRLQSTLDAALQTMWEFFGVDTSFLRRNDRERDITVLVSEWPHRENVPDPDPLGEVPFAADPVFAASRDLAAPFVMRPAGSPDAYQERVAEGSGIAEVSMAMVPLLRDDVTTGVLGFVKFGDRAWAQAEINALQAIAALIVQLQARVEAEERLKHSAYHDELTGLPNRRALLEELDRRLVGSTGSTTVMFLDLDRFKAMNDLLGHGAGDRILTTVGERLHSSLPEAFVARLSGDEFVVAFSDLAGKRSTSQLAERVLGIVSQPIEISGHEMSRTVSIGIAVQPAGTGSGEELLAHADVALRAAKTRGGNRAVTFDDRLRRMDKERSDTEVMLRRAIDHGHLVLYYQPEIDLRTGKLLAVEALLRWNHPERGLVSAGEFISVAEDTGLIVDVGRWVLEEACRQMADWQRRLPERRFLIRVNMSPVQLATGNIVDLISRALRDNGVTGRSLCLEITEHAVMRDVKQAMKALHELKSLGVTLAIDDFGTGFSSMTQLKQLPVDALKIDRSFVNGIGNDGGDRAIVDATIRLAMAFGLEVVAEGIETPETLDKLVRMGCHRGQGYFLSKPKAAAELERLLMQGGLDLAELVRKAAMRTARREPEPVAAGRP